MNNFFLLNEAIDIANFNSFKEGMGELIAIDRQTNDVFLKHHSIYNLPILETLYSSFGYEEQIISQFIEQLSISENYLSNEVIFDATFPNDANAFLGIDFSTLTISATKQIIDITSYKEWKFSTLSNFGRLLNILGVCKFEPTFKRDFDSFADNVQESIIAKFNYAKSRNLLTPFYPDEKIVKNVSQGNDSTKVLELRVYTPIALRVYFNEVGNTINLASIEQKSNPNQNEDIKAAITILKRIM